MLSGRLRRSIVLMESPPGANGVVLESASGHDPTPTRDNVLAHLAECPVAHFACHGADDPIDPSQSRLLLHDYREAPLTVSALGSVHLEHARLAYLSACDTALSTNTLLIDEAIHLTSGFHSRDTLM